MIRTSHVTERMKADLQDELRRAHRALDGHVDRQDGTGRWLAVDQRIRRLIGEDWRYEEGGEGS